MKAELDVLVSPAGIGKASPATKLSSLLPQMVILHKLMSRNPLSPAMCFSNSISAHKKVSSGIESNMLIDNKKSNH